MPAEPLNLITQEEPNSAKGLTELVGGSFPRQDFGSDPSDGFPLDGTCARIPRHVTQRSHAWTPNPDKGRSVVLSHRLVVICAATIHNESTSRKNAGAPLGKMKRGRCLGKNKVQQRII